MISVPTTKVCSKAPLHFINLHRAHNAFAGMRVHQVFLRNSGSPVLL